MDVALEHIRGIGAAFLDGWVAVDAQRQVVDFNPAYRAMFSRAQARKLKGSNCCQFLRLSVCSDGCLAARCLEEQAPLRLDEIPAEAEGDERPRRLIASAAPLSDSAALIVLRDVSDAADVQRKYKEMLERETREKESLREEIVRKTKELMDTNMELNRVQDELMRFKKGLLA